MCETATVKRQMLTYDELAQQLENIAGSAQSVECSDESRVRLLEAAKKVIPGLETPSEAAQRVLYGVCR